MKRVKSEASVLVEAPNGNGHLTDEKSVGPQGKTKKTKEVVIEAPNFQTVEFLVRGRAPYVQNAFSKKITEQIRETQEEGSTAKGKKVRLPKDFENLFLQAQHIAVTGDVRWNGIPSSGIRASLISACRTVNGMPMTKAKLAATVIQDGFDINDGQALTRITKGEPKHVEHMVKLPSGVPDIRVRAWWDSGWEAVVRIEFDADMLKLSDVGNLLMRAGRQVGWGEGRPDSKDSAGMGWGTFDVVS